MEGRAGHRLGSPANQRAERRNAPMYEWFADARVNTCYNALTATSKTGRGDQASDYHDSPITGQSQDHLPRIAKPRRLAGALRAQRGRKGDRVIIYMPMVPEALEAMLACARIGAVHSVVFGGFAANELAVRIDDATPKRSSPRLAGFEPGAWSHTNRLLDGAIELASHKPELCVILQRDKQLVDSEAGDVDWHEFQEGVTPAMRSGRGHSPRLHPLHLRHDGRAQRRRAPTAGHLVALNWTMKEHLRRRSRRCVLGRLRRRLGRGHSYICYAPLIHGNTTMVFEGKPVGTPDAGTFWRVISEHNVDSFFTAPTAFRAVKREDPEGELSEATTCPACDRCIWPASAPIPTRSNGPRQLKVPVIDHWWQTETG